MLDTVQYIAVQLSITPESHFREDWHTTKGNRAFVGMHCMYCTNTGQKLPCTDFMTRFFECFRTLAGLDSHHPIGQPSTLSVAGDWWMWPSADSPHRDTVPAARLPSCPSDDLQSFWTTDQNIWEWSRSHSHLLQEPGGKDLSHHNSPLCKVFPWIPSKQPQLLRGAVTWAPRCFVFLFCLLLHTLVLEEGGCWDSVLVVHLSFGWWELVRYLVRGKTSVASSCVASGDEGGDVVSGRVKSIPADALRPNLQTVGRWPVQSGNVGRNVC